MQKNDTALLLHVTNSNIGNFKWKCYLDHFTANFRHLTN